MYLLLDQMLLLDSGTQDKECKFLINPYNIWSRMKFSQPDIWDAQVKLPVGNAIRYKYFTVYYL